tara:strand:- start:90 stop:1934 length:1845 start_codon:yes stop_codon:yes gene_type:complete
MKNINNNILNFSIISLIVFIISLKWKSIGIPLNNENEVIGYLILKNYNPINDTIRYFLFISLPLISFMIINYFFNSKNVLSLKNIFKTSASKDENISVYEYKAAFSILLILIFLEVMTLDLTHLKLDTLHDGDFLTPAQNFFYYNKIWSASYTVHGGSDVIYPVLAWKIFGLKTIGAVRIFFIVLITFLKISCVFLAFQMTKISILNKNNKLILFFLLSIFLIGMSHYQLPMNYSLFSYRDIYVVLFLIFLIEALTSNKNKIIINFLISLIPIISLIMHIDIGVYLYFTYFFYLIFLLINKNYKEILINLFLTTIFWVFFFLIIGRLEFYSFYFHTINIIQNIDLIHGLEFPQPFFEIGENKDAPRATKSLLLQLGAGIFIINAIINKNSKFSFNKKILLFFFFILSFIMYKNALGRSDSYHIRMSTDFPLLIVIFFLLNYFFKFSENKFKNLLNNKKIIFTIFVILITIFSLQNIKFKNLSLAKSKFENLLISKDEVYINDKTKNFINFMGNELKNESCIYNFTEDLSIPYLLKKPSCTKYFAPWLASGKKLEKDYINILKKNKSPYIVYQSSQFNVDGIDTTKRLQKVNKFIIENYDKYLGGSGYEIYRINN